MWPTETRTTVNCAGRKWRETVQYKLSWRSLVNGRFHNNNLALEHIVTVLRSIACMIETDELSATLCTVSQIRQSFQKPK